MAHELGDSYVFFQTVFFLLSLIVLKSFSQHKPSAYLLKGVLTEIFTILILIIFINKVSMFNGKHKSSVQPPKVKWRLSMTYSAFWLTYPTSSPPHSFDWHILPPQNPEGHRLAGPLQHLHMSPYTDTCPFPALFSILPQASCPPLLVGLLG